MSNKNKETFAEFLKELEKNTVAKAKPVEEVSERKYFLIVSEGERT